MKKNISIVGSNIKLEVGDKILLERKTFGSDTIVSASKDGVAVGYVSNCNSNAKEGTYLADSLTLPCFAIVEEEYSFLTKNGKTSTGYVATLVEETKQGDKAKREIKVKGAKVKHPAKVQVIQSLKKGEFVPLSIKDNEVFLGDDSAGVLEDSTNAENCVAIRVEGTTFIVEVEEVSSSDIASNSLSALMDEILDKQIVSKEDLEERVEYLRGYNINDENIFGVLSGYREYSDEVKAKIPKSVIKFQDHDGILAKTIAYLNIGEHLKLEGDKGVGKNVLVGTLAWLYNKPLYEVSMNIETDKMDLQGSKTIKTDENGNTIVGFDKSEVIEAVENDGFLNLDEVNVAKPEVLVWLHSLTDNRGRVFIPGYGTVSSNGSFRVLLTLNKGYHGTNDLNEATNDRFVPIVFPTSNSIVGLLSKKFPKTDAGVLHACEQVYQALRNSIKNGELSGTAISVRGFETVCKISKVIGLKEAMVDNLAYRIQDDLEQDIIKSLIDDILG